MKNTSLMIATFCLAVFTGAHGQTFHFENMIDHDTNKTQDWSVNGSVRLTREDFAVFEPTVKINVVQELCTVDLTECPPKDLPSTPTPCFCVSHTGDMFHIQVGGQATPAQSGGTIQAVVPGRGALKNIQGAATIGTIPNITEKEVGATFRVDGGSFQKLAPAQNLSVCANLFVTVEVCLDKQQAGAVLQMSIDDVNTWSSSRQTCVSMSHRYSFDYRASHRLIVSYQKSESGPIDNMAIFMINENVNGCVSSTTPAPPVTDAMTTPVPLSVEDMCSHRERSVTTLQSERKALVDTVSFGKTWTVFQRRVSGAVDFERGWSAYVSGFGGLNDSYWLGLETVHQMCNKDSHCEMLIHLEWFDQPYNKEIPRQPEGCYYAHHRDFWLEGSANNYTLFISGYIGTAGNAMNSVSGDEFHTKDRDNNSNECVKNTRGAWWSGWGCSSTNLNGIWKGSGVKSKTGVQWYPLTGQYYSVSFSELKFRQK